VCKVRVFFDIANIHKTIILLIMDFRKPEKIN